MADDVAGRGAEPASGAVNLMKGYMESSEFAKSIGLRLPANRIEGLWEDLGPPPGALLRTPADTSLLLSLR